MAGVFLSPANSQPGSINALRHSFATPLPDKGTDVTMIMKRIGHNHIKTTLRYLPVSNNEKEKIRSEEIYRQEVRKELDKLYDGRQYRYQKLVKS